MAEKTIVVDGLNISYQGLFNLKEFYGVIDTWFAKHFYNKVEHGNAESVHEDGKQILLELGPTRKINDYARIQIMVFIDITKCTEKVIERDGVKLKLHHGNISATFKAFLITDYEKHWESKPTYFFFRTIVDKWVYKHHTSTWKVQTEKECSDLMKEVRDYLNLERFK